jgi:hypothetical protein
MAPVSWTAAPNTMDHAVWEALPELLPRGLGDSVLTRSNPQQEALRPGFTPRRSGGRDESASHMTVELCACVRAKGSSRGDVKGDITAKPYTVRCRSIQVPVSIRLAHGPVHTGLSPVRDRLMQH